MNLKPRDLPGSLEQPNGFPNALLFLLPQFSRTLVLNPDPPVAKATRDGSLGMPATQAWGWKELESPVWMRSWDHCDISCRRGRGGRGAEGGVEGRALGSRPGHGRFPGWPASLQPPAHRPPPDPAGRPRGNLRRAFWSRPPRSCFSFS